MSCDAKLVVLVVLAGSLLATAGCGDGRPPAYLASGKVIFEDGSPVLVGSIELKSREHKAQARGEIGPDGRFTLTTYEPGDGAVAGKHDCVVVQFVVAEEVQGHEPTTLGVVHPRFASYSTSGLECEISATEPNDLTIRVQGLGPGGDREHDRQGHEQENEEKSP